MLLNAYGAAVFKSDIDFYSWARAKGIKTDIKAKSDDLAADGFKALAKIVKKEEYEIKRFLYRFIYIANTVGIEYAEKWIDSCKEDKYRQKDYARMIKNKPKLAYCHLKSSNGQCRIDCPFWNRRCQITYAEEQQSRDLLEEYKPLERRK